MNLANIWEPKPKTSKLESISNKADIWNQTEEKSSHKEENPI